MDQFEWVERTLGDGTQLLRRVIRLFEKTPINYVLAGAAAAGAYSTPRFGRRISMVASSGDREVLESVLANDRIHGTLEGSNLVVGAEGSQVQISLRFADEIGSAIPATLLGLPVHVPPLHRVIFDLAEQLSQTPRQRGHGIDFLALATLVLAHPDQLASVPEALRSRLEEITGL